MKKYEVLDEEILKYTDNLTDLETIIINLSEIGDLYHIDYEIVKDLEEYFTLEEMVNLLGDKINDYLDNLENKKKETIEFLSLVTTLDNEKFYLLEPLLEGKITMNEDYLEKLHNEYMLKYYDKIDEPFVDKKDLVPKIKLFVRSKHGREN